MIKFYYGPEIEPTDDFRIIPAPRITINQNNVYANDVIIGYTYNITLNGYASNYIAEYVEVLSSGVDGSIIGGGGGGGEEEEGTYGAILTESSGSITTEYDIVIITEDTVITIPSSSTSPSSSFITPTNPGSAGGMGLGTTTSLINSNGASIRQVLYSINLIKKILSRNGSTLRITDIDNNNLVVAKGGVLKSLTFSETDNSWVKYAQYTAEIEFNELILIDESITCSNGQINSDSITSNLIDINQYKIKEFTDNWTFTVEDDALNFVIKSDNTEQLNIKNTIINLSYNISATGKNYFIEDQMLPGWLQAKNFVQSRLYNQVLGLSSALGLTGQACNAALSLADIHAPNTGILFNVANNYGIYDETIQCSTSESDGSFSLDYNAKLKVNESSSFSSSSTIHTFTKDISSQFDGGKKNITISVNGTIQGLCIGGLINSGGNFTLPNNGTLLIGPSYNNKFDNANSLLSNITNQDDLSESFKDALDINKDSLEFTSNSCDDSGGQIKPKSFNLTKNYMEGTITYSAEYETNRSCSAEVNDKTITQTSIDVSLPTPVIAEFPIPGGKFVLQDINTVSARKVTISTEGRSDKKCCLSKNQGVEINTLLTEIVTGDIESFLPDGFNLPDEDEEGRTLVQKELNYNPLDGSYSITVAYICSASCEVIL